MIGKLGQKYILRGISEIEMEEALAGIDNVFSTGLCCEALSPLRGSEVLGAVSQN